MSGEDESANREQRAAREGEAAEELHWSIANRIMRAERVAFELVDSLSAALLKSLPGKRPNAAGICRAQKTQLRHKQRNRRSQLLFCCAKKYAFPPLSNWSIIHDLRRQNRRSPSFCYIQLSFSYPSSKSVLFDDSHGRVGAARAASLGRARVAWGRRVRGKGLVRWVRRCWRGSAWRACPCLAAGGRRAAAAAGTCCTCPRARRPPRPKSSTGSSAARAFRGPSPCARSAG